MAELATIARPYAEALYKAVQADLETAEVWLNELAAIVDDGTLQQFANDPKTTDVQVFDLVTGVMKVDLPEKGKNFLRAVIENNRLRALPEIAVLFRTLKNANDGSSDAVVYSAFPIETAALADVATTLEKLFNRKLNLAVVLDAELIGGIRVAVGDEVLDTSVKARLDQMKAALIA